MDEMEILKEGLISCGFRVGRVYKGGFFSLPWIEVILPEGVGRRNFRQALVDWRKYCFKKSDGRKWPLCWIPEDKTQEVFIFRPFSRRTKFLRARKEAKNFGEWLLGNKNQEKR